MRNGKITFQTLLIVSNTIITKNTVMDPSYTAKINRKVKFDQNLALNIIYVPAIKHYLLLTTTDLHFPILCGYTSCK